MRSLKGLTLVVVASVLAIAVPTASAGPTTVTSVYTVGGLAVPGATGLALQAGMTVTITATGAVCPFGSSYCPGPNGNATWNTTGSAYGGFPLPGAPAWGLIARVGSGPWMHVGAGPTQVSGVGVLQLAVNDDLLVDNRGSFTVTVSYTCWPGWGYGDKNHTHCGPPGLANKPSAQSGNGGPPDDRGNGNSGGNGGGNGAEKGQGNAKGHSK